ncbi:hypothetical protein [Oceanobacillus sp. 1P07AA]|uniref:hypothetical protein n=1 Tax=Oceanobacillus sp. 1P07AA TaxID=3132293 RepID=UPI0039A421D1
MDNIKSVTLMETFIKSGGYRSLKFAKLKKDKIVNEVKNHLKDSELKRHEFSRYGLVAKFAMNRDFKWDYIGLNDYLADLGLLIPVAKMLPDKELKAEEVYERIKDFELPRKSYSLKPSFNKDGKNYNTFNEEELEIYEQLNLDMLLNVFDAAKRDVLGCEEHYESIKQEIMSCGVLQDKKKIKYAFGSLSLSLKKEGYDINSIEGEYGIDFLINYTKPDMNKLNEFILQGTITQGEVFQFRKDVTSEDKEMKFTLMEIEDEHKQIQMLSSRSLKASLARDARMKA